jgi:hypothetical protein
MKYTLIPFIALDLGLSLIVGIEYDCTEQEMFPKYYGSPFVFKQKSLASSMEYYYSISGVILNTFIWSLILIVLRLAILKLINFYNESKVIKAFYKIIVGVLIVFSGLNIFMNYVMKARGFEENFNYWYMDLDKEADNWGMKCEGKWNFWIF